MANGTLSVGTLNVVINGTNDGPVVTASTAAGGVTEDGAQTANGSISFSDADLSDTHTASITSGPDSGSAFGTLALSPVSEAANAANGSVNWTYTIDNAKAQALSEGETVTETYTVTIDDGHGGTVSQSVTVTITGTNDAPVVTGAVEGLATEDGAASALDGLANTSDVDHLDMLSVINVPDTLPPGVTYDPETHTFTLDPSVADYQHLADGDTTVVTVTYDVFDGHTSAPASVSWTVSGTNDAPVAVADSNFGTEDATITGGVAANDSDIDDGHTLTYSLDAPVAGLTLNADGTYSFDAGDAAYQHLAAGATEVVSASYTVTDEHGASATSTLEITLTGTNDVPVITGTTSGSVTEDVGTPPHTAGTLVVSDVDDGQSHTVAATGTSMYGAWSVDANGNWTYDLTHNGDAAIQSLNTGATLTDGFDITTADGTAQHISITINGADEPVTTASSPPVYIGSGDPNDFDSVGTNGDNTVNANSGTNSIYGGTGNDTLNGSTNQNATDTIFGGSGNDTISAKQGADIIYGGSGSDIINGDAGNDTLIGGYGADTLTGGAGFDKFIYLTLKDTGDHITDFAPGGIVPNIEVLDFQLIDADTAVGGDQAFVSATLSNTAVAHGINYFQSGANTIVQADTDGNTATAEFEITLDNVLATNLNSGNFLL